MTNAARTLVAVAILSVVVAVVSAFTGVLLYRASQGDLQTHLHPASAAVETWATRWTPDSAPLLFRSALSTAPTPATPVLAGQTLLVLGSDLRVHALDPGTGLQRWEVGYPDGRRVVSFRVDASRLVLVVRQPDPATGLADSSLVAVNLTTRAVLWERALDADVYSSSLQVAAGTVYLAVGDNVDGAAYDSLRQRNASVSLHPRLRAYALADGTRRWEQVLPEQAGEAPVERVGIVVTDRQVVAAESSLSAPIGLAAFDSASGLARWHTLDGSEALGVTRGMLVTRTGGYVVLVAPSSDRALDRLVSLAPRSGPTVVAGSVLYSVASDQVTAVDLVAGRQLWTTALDRPQEAFASGDDLTRLPAVQDGHLYLGGRDEDVYSIDVLTGVVEWKFPAQRQDVLVAGPAPVRYGDLLLVQDDQLTAYRAPDP